MASLLVYTGDKASKEVLLDKPLVLIGRRGGCDVALEHPIVSGEHAVVAERHQGEHWIEDKNSTNGTLLNGERIKNAPLVDQDELKIGPFTLRYLNANSKRLQAGSASSALSAELLIVSSGGHGHRLPIAKPVVTVGKPGRAIASIAKRPMGYTISHLQGDPPTQLNGENISAIPVYLEAGDRILVDGVELEFILTTIAAP